MKLVTIAAYAEQGGETYQGVDLWQSTTLPAGSKLVQLDYDKNRMSKAETAGNYFTTIEELEKHTDPHSGKVDTASLSESVQVMARDRAQNGDYKHYPNVTVYEVVEPMPLAVARTTDNPAFGKGGADQFFTPLDRRDIINQEIETKGPNGATVNETIGFLKPLKVLEASNYLPRHEIYDLIKEARDNGVTNPENVTIKSLNNEFKQELDASGDRNVIDKVQGMDERVKFSDTARDIVKKPIDWKVVENTALPRPNTPEEKLQFALSGVREPERQAAIKELMKKVEISHVVEKARPKIANEASSRSNGALSAQNERTERAQKDNGEDFDIGDD